MTMDMGLGTAPPQGGGGSLEEEFTRGFSDLAYSALQKQAPDLVKDVITFRVLETEPEKGMGVGCFIVAHGGEVFFVPVVVSDNAVKPLDAFYSRRLDRYYPLTPEWLAEANKSQLSELGAGVKTPPTLQTDVDIRNLIVPPTTGRYSYASADNPVDCACRHALARAEDRPKLALRLMDALTVSPPAVKTAFAHMLKKRPVLLEKMAKFYGASAVVEALRPAAKTAAADEGVVSRKEYPLKHDVFAVHVSKPFQEVQERLEPGEAAGAFSSLRITGFYTKDRRKGTSKNLQQYAESDLQLTEPESTGMYRVWLTDGTPEEALVLVNPTALDAWGLDDVHLPSPKTKKYVVVLKDGRCAVLHHLVASPVLAASQGAVDDAIKALKKAPSNDEYGVFVSSGGMSLRSTCPTRVRKVSSTGGGLACETEGGMYVRIDAKQYPPHGMVRAGRTVSLGRGWGFVPCKDEWMHPTLFACNPTEVLRAVDRKLMAAGAEPAEIKMGSDRRFYVDGDRIGLGLADAVTKIAVRYDVALGDAVAAVKLAVARTPVRLWAVPKSKTAAEGPPADDGGTEDPNAPPAMPMDPAMMAPPPPSGLDLAIAEQMQQIQMQIQALNDKAMALQTVQQRAQQIDAGGGAAAAPMGAAAMAGGPPPAVGGMPAPGMDPNAPAGAPMGTPGAGMAPQEQPTAPAPAPAPAPQAPQGMPGQPGMPAPGQPGMDPSMAGQQQAPPPMMTNESLSAGDVESSISPQFLEMAGQLEDAQVFDAAALASLAKQKQLRGPMLSYTTNLEKALDNLGRLLVLLDLREADLKESVGNDAYTSTEQVVRDTFRGLGEVILNTNQLTDQVGTPGSRMT